jgi:hypothetical protein
MTTRLVEPVVLAFAFMRVFATSSSAPAVGGTGPVRAMIPVGSPAIN